MTRPTPTHLKLLRGNPGKRSVRPEVEAERCATTCPEPPPFVAANGFASDEYWRTAPELARLGRLSPLDLMPLCAYAMAYARWRTAEEAAARMAEGDGETGGLVVKTSVGDQRRNVLAKIAADSARDMLRYAAPFGLTPLARARLPAGVDHEPPPGGKFHGLIR